LPADRIGGLPEVADPAFDEQDRPGQNGR
jgi:hypothetical protein